MSRPRLRSPATPVGAVPTARADPAASAPDGRRHGPPAAVASVSRAPVVCKPPLPPRPPGPRAAAAAAPASAVRLRHEPRPAPPRRRRRARRRRLPRLLRPLRVGGNWVGPTGRVLSGAVFSLGLIAAGLRLMRAYRPLAQGLAAAGLAGLYVTAFAAHSVYSLSRARRRPRSCSS